MLHQQQCIQQIGVNEPTNECFIDYMNECIKLYRPMNGNKPMNGLLNQPMNVLLYQPINGLLNQPMNGLSTKPMNG